MKQTKVLPHFDDEPASREAVRVRLAALKYDFLFIALIFRVIFFLYIYATQFTKENKIYSRQVL